MVCAVAFLAAIFVHVGQQHEGVAAQAAAISQAESSETLDNANLRGRWDHGHTEAVRFSTFFGMEERLDSQD